MRSLCLALSFLTLLPVAPRRGECPPAAITGSAAFFPLAGWLVGLSAVGLGWLAMVLGSSPFAAAVMAVAFEAWLTRGLHLDGVADLVDGFGGSFDRERRLAIMKDSATGAFGVAGLIFVILLKIAGLALVFEIAGQQTGIPWGILLPAAFVPAAARWFMVMLAWGSRYPRAEGTGSFFVGAVGWGQILPGGVLLMAGVLPVIGHLNDFLPFMIISLGVFLPSLWLRFRAHKLLGGVTGDVLGAACEFGEAAGFIVAACLLS